MSETAKTAHMPFAIDRLRGARAIRVETPKPKCEHPYWQERGDGHGHNYWECTSCRTTQWIAPWVLRGRPELPAAHPAPEPAPVAGVEDA